MIGATVLSVLMSAAFKDEAEKNDEWYYLMGLEVIRAILGFACAAFGSLVIVMSLIGVPIFWRFDQRFKHRPNIMDFGIPISSIMSRTLSYMFAVVYKNRSTQHRYFKYTFRGYDFQANTNLFEKIYSYICVWSGILALIFCCLWAIIGAIIYLQTGAWPQ